MKPRRTGPFPYVPAIRRPRLQWPNDAKLALWVAPNVEFFPFNQPVPFGIGINPDVLAWSQRDYGGRVGVFRVMQVLAKHGIRATVALNADVCDAYPEFIEEACKLEWEFMGHGETNSNMVDTMDLGEQKRVIGATFDRIEKATGKRPRGWLSPGVRMNWDTPDILIDAGCEYYCDFVNDDQPYLMDVDGRRLVNVPYSSEMNDLPAFMRANRTAEEFATMIKRQFDVLYREGAESGRVMCIALHPFLIGVPHRIDALDDALSYICGHAGVWRATASEILDAYLATDPSV